MKINEIRIGNLINCFQGELKISAIGDKYIQDKHYQTFLIKDCEPIPITEEWLVKAGFEKIGNRHPTSTTWKFENNGSVYHFQLNTKYDITNPNCGYMGVFDDSDDTLDLEGVLKDTPQTVLMNFAWHIKTVHQLQNLYFSLTSNELLFDEK